MTQRLNPRCTSLLLAGSFILAVSSQAWAIAPQVKDAAKFFKDETIRKVDRAVRDIYRTYDRDVLIETVTAVPEDQLARVKAMNAEDREKFFSNWATDRAEEQVVRGIYILICKDPRHLEIRVTGRGRSAFNEAEYRNLKEILLKAFRANRYDEGLQEAVEYCKARFAAEKKKEG